jgi:hypothetical protein
MVIPFASLATPVFDSKMARVILATLRDGGGLGALLCRKPLEVACNSARLASRMASQTAPVANANLV